MAEQQIFFDEYKPEDYNGFITCINDFYCGGYPYPQYLDKDNISRLIGSGDMIITLARCEGKIVGTSAAQRLHGAFEGSVLLLLRSVLVAMQRQGIGSRQECYLLSLVKEKFPDAISLYADVMTHSAASQKTMIKQGFTLCGFRPMLYKNEIIVPKLKLEAGTKMTQAIYCRANGKYDVKLFAPKEHRAVIEKLYRELGVACEFCDSAARDGIALTVTEKAIHQSAEIKIDTGSNSIAELSECVARYCYDGYTLVAYINMLNTSCEAVYSLLRGKNFYFSGIKPLSRDGEYLVMAQTDNCISNFGDIKIPDEKAELLNYVLRGITQ